jgi:hypothetical protein
MGPIPFAPGGRLRQLDPQAGPRLVAAEAATGSRPESGACSVRRRAHPGGDAMTEPILAPMLMLVGWTFVMWVWMYATRIPAMRAAGIDPAGSVGKADLEALPLRVQNIANNYNHLHEQPVLFYALCTWCVLAGAGDATNVALAWGYVALRVVHSGIQATTNFIPLRFGVFALGSVLLFGIFARNALLLLRG